MKLKKLYLFVGCLLLTGCGAKETEPVSTETVEVMESTELEKGDETENTSPADAIAEYDFNEYVTLGEYKGLSIPVEAVEVSAMDVDAVLEQTIQSYTEYKELDVATPQDDDWVSLRLTFADDSIWEDYVQVGDEGFPEEVKNCVKSSVAGTVNEVTISDASYFGSDEENAECSVEVLGIYEKIVPEATDEWINSISEFATLDAWKKATAANLMAEAEDTRNYNYKSALYELIMSNAEFKTFPQELIDSMYSQYHEDDVAAAESMNMTLEELVLEYYGFNSLDEYELGLYQFIDECIKDEFLTAALAEELDISYTSEEYDTFVKECLDYYGYKTAEELEEEYGKSAIEQACLNDVVWDAVMDLNTMTEK